MTVAQMLRSMDSAELTEWAAHLMLKDEEATAAKERYRPSADSPSKAAHAYPVGVKLPPITHEAIRNRVAAFVRKQ